LPRSCLADLSRDQYFYKLTRTFLKDSQTLTNVDPIFSYGGDLFSFSSSSSLTKRSIPPRWAETPLRQTSAQTPRRSLPHQTFQHVPAGPPDDAASSFPLGKQGENTSAGPFSEPEKRLAVYEQRISEQDGKIASKLVQQETLIKGQKIQIEEQNSTLAKYSQKVIYQDTKIEVLSGQIESLQAMLVELRTSMQELKSQIVSNQVEKLEKSDFLSGFESMVHAMRDARSTIQELNALRAENKTMKARLQTIASAMGRISGTADASDATEIDLPESGRASLKVLGKRKRDANNARARPRRSLRLDGVMSDGEPFERDFLDELHQVPTPRSSGASDQSDSTSPSQEARSDSTQLDVSPLPSSGVHLSLAHGRPHSEQGSQQNAQAKTLSVGEVGEMNPEALPQLHQTSISRERSVSSAGADRTLRESTRSNGLLFPHGESELMSKGDAPVAILELDQYPERDGPVSMIARAAVTMPDEQHNPQNNSHNNLPLPQSATSDVRPGNGIISRDDESAADGNTVRHRPDVSPPVAANHVDEATGERQYSISDDEDGTANVGSNNDLPPGSEKNHRRVTDSRIQQQATRSMAPEPSKRRRTLRGRSTSVIDLEHNLVSTPESIAQKIREKGKPRQPKPRIQTTEKMLNKELADLGLTEWIGRDKNTPEYRAAVDAARAHQRELKRLAQLSNRGLNAPQILQPCPPAAPAVAIPAELKVPPPPVASDPLVTLRESESVEASIGASKKGTSQLSANPTDGQTAKADQLIDSTNPSSSGGRAFTRRRQREEEMRKRDQMAKEALESEVLAEASRS